MAQSANPTHAPATLEKGGSGRLWALYAIGIILAVFAAYYPGLHGAFVWDDELLTDQLKPLFQDLSGLKEMWRDPSALYNYYPITGTTFWIDRHLWGDWTLPYHVENVAFHACAALLFCRALQRLEVPGSWLAGAVYAVHPVMAESVAFITERRNMLSMIFFLAALLAYGRFAAFWSGRPAAPRRWGAYLGALLLFAGALLAKVTAYAFPPAMLLLCWWKKGRLRWKADVLPLLPFFALALAFGVVAMWNEVHRVGARGPEWDLTMPERFLVAGRALCFYATKFFWPADVSFVYPRWQLNPGAWWQWLFPIGFSMFAVILWTARRRMGRGPVTALLFYAGTLLPVLGFVNVYGMLYSYVADRWIYVPSLSLCAVAGVLAVRAGHALRRPAASLGLAVVVLPCLLALTWQQAATFANSYTLWQATLRHNPACWMAYINLCHASVADGHIDEAMQEIKKALELNPRSADAHNNLAHLLAVTGKPDEGEVEFQKALQLNPGNYKIRQNYAKLLMQQGRSGEAFVHTYHPQVFQPQEKNWDELVELAWLLAVSADPSMRSGKLAVELAEKANDLSKNSNPQVLQTLAAAYAEAGRFDQAVETSKRALALAGQGALASAIRSQQSLYESKMPFHTATKSKTDLPQTPAATGIR